MLRGYQKRVVYLKNTGSEIFKEAYFIIEDKRNSPESDTKELVDEANKIINENFYGRKKGFYKKALPYLSFLGGIISSLICFVLYLVIR